MNSSGSPRGKLDIYDWKKVGKGAGLAAAGAVAAFLLGQTDLIEQLTPENGEGFDNALMLGLAAFFSVTLNALTKLNSDTRN